MGETGSNVWNPWWHGLVLGFLLAPTLFMETHQALPDVHISSTGSPPECVLIAGVQDLL